MHVWECDFEGDLLFLEGWRDQWGERIVSFEALKLCFCFWVCLLGVFWQGVVERKFLKVMEINGDKMVSLKFFLLVGFVLFWGGGWVLLGIYEREKVLCGSA